MFLDSTYVHLLDAEKIVNDFELALRSVKGKFESISIQYYETTTNGFYRTETNTLDGFRVIRNYDTFDSSEYDVYNKKYHFNSHYGQIANDKQWKKKLIQKIRTFAMQANNRYTQMREAAKQAA
jgi:hypothetical protein